MTDQVTDDNKTIFEDKKEGTPAKVTPDDQKGDKSVTPDLNAVFNDHLSTIVDDKGEPKYKDVFTALEALKHTQDHIKTLENENKQYRESKTEETTLTEALDKISAKREPEPTKSEVIDAEQLKGMTFEAIQEYERTKQRESNLNSVSDALVKQYGDADKAKQAYAAKAEELGIDEDTLKELSAKSPKAALQYFNTSISTPNTLKSSINSQAIPSPTKETIDYSARYFNSSSPAVSKWREAGEGLNN